MTVFGDYSRYYTLLYADKPYEAECDFVLGRLKAHGLKPASLLDLGCGTGSHDLCLAEKGIAVTGVDISESMLGCARERAGRTGAGAFSGPEFLSGDVRGLRLERSFDAVISLFHVMSYQRTEKDALAMLRTAYAHLPEGGLFFFDFWHGTGVLGDPPGPRSKRLENERMIIERSSRPEQRHNDNTVIVHFEIRITDKADGTLSLLREEHPMRYWFLPELRFLAELSGFSVAAEGGWMHDGAPRPTDWNAWMLVQR